MTVGEYFRSRPVPGRVTSRGRGTGATMARIARRRAALAEIESPSDLNLSHGAVQGGACALLAFWLSSV